MQDLQKFLSEQVSYVRQSPSIIEAEICGSNQREQMRKLCMDAGALKTAIRKIDSGELIIP